MSSCLQYRVPVTTNDGYTITNGRLGSLFEETEMDIGSNENPPIAIISYKGETTEVIYGRRSAELVPIEVWKNAIKGKSTADWLLTYIAIHSTHVIFSFADKDYSKESCTVTVRAIGGMEIWLEVPRNDGLPPAKYFIDTCYDDKSSTENLIIRVTEVYDRMKKMISVVNEPNPYYNPAIHHGSLSSIAFLLITEYRD